MDALLAALVRGDQVEWPFAGAGRGAGSFSMPRASTASSRSSPGSIVGEASLNGWPATLRSAIATRARQHAIVEQLSGPS